MEINLDDMAIRIRDVRKSFRVYHDKGYSLKERLLFWGRNKHEVRSVLNGVSLDVKKGEAVGIIGHNGCGKSTLLKLMTKIIYPDSGTIEMNGRISSLLELGAGFHPDMSGKENIYINASIFGLNREEIESRIQDIIDFSELGDYIDSPVRTYSSGMYMRLAFAVAINVDADILLIDEILAVGDASFQQKCFNRLLEIKASGTTIVIVSHTLGQIEQICGRSIWLNYGKIEMDGPPIDVHPMYMQVIMNTPYVLGGMERGAEPRMELGSMEAEITAVTLSGEPDENGDYRYETGSDIELKIEYKRNDPALKHCTAGIRIFRTDGLDMYGTNTLIDSGETVPLSDKGAITLSIESNPLMAGDYIADVALNDNDFSAHHHIFKAARFSVYNTRQDLGVVRISHKWIY